MTDSDSSSSLSSVVSTADESIAESINRSAGITKYFKKAEKPEPPPPSPKRPPSPPHEYVLADNPNIAFLVMFRSRFSDVFPKSLPHYGPHDIEKGVVEPAPGDHIERLLCALLGLVLNRKKDVERGHYQRALEEAIQTHQSQWPKAWQGKSPLSGGGGFATMTPEERIQLLTTLTLWALSSSESVQAKLKDSYKQSRHDGDRNQPLSVQPWGTDTLKRRYWLIEGQDDTHFRLYRESNPALKTNTWWSVAGTIPELRTVAESLATEKSRASKELSQKILNSIPRFENSEEKRKRRDYRLARKAAFARPEPGFSLYEGRTRGKRIKYTFSDDDDFSSEAFPSRKSTRNQSRASSPPDNAGPTFTASGRQVRSRVGGMYGQTVLGKRPLDATDDEPSSNPAGGEDGGMENGRSRRSRRDNRSNGWEGSTPSDAFDSAGDSEGEDEHEAASSENEWDEDADLAADDEDEDEAALSDADSFTADLDLDRNKTLVVKLRYGNGNGVAAKSPQAGSDQVKPMIQEATNNINTPAAMSTEVPANNQSLKAAGELPKAPYAVEIPKSGFSGNDPALKQAYTSTAEKQEFQLPSHNGVA
ncbi:uncharacterized protein GIQ15_05187 [Arthroderma uncinatum]|uniref:uncharacterized protein n=1 Tax=Arthroderma uncinatum TaxID=74035 RepID=UPI00144A5829|nr:uncharacterized protein GIQ15_05187 [Arthroderma uncinatum]KAF3482428.1 hypothetical protein GIQ15_05187 [Arthroderma uncinatum]